MQIDRGLAGSLGVTVGQVAQALRPAFAGIDVGDWVDPSGETRDVTVRLAPEARTMVADLESLPLVVPARTVRARSSARPGGARSGAVVGPGAIDHLDRDRVITVAGQHRGGRSTEVMADDQRALEAIRAVAAGVRSPGRRDRGSGGGVRDASSALGVAVMLMYLILLVMQFGSFLEPLAIMLSLPLSLIGVMLALLVTGSTLNIMSMIGVILLMGIVAKNAILLIDFAKWAEERGMDAARGADRAGRVRLRPILMTTFALIAGMMPVAIGAGEGGDFRAPLGIAVIGGVITSTLLTLLADARDWVGVKLFGPRKEQKDQPERVHVPPRRPAERAIIL